jgi:hypothetical protein
MKNPIAAGFIAGIVKAICAFFSVPLGAAMKLWEPAPVPHLDQLLSIIGFDIMWGVILALIFSILYTSIPGKGIKKGLVYGLIIYLVSNIRAANLIWAYVPDWAAIFAFTGIFALIPYGIVLGYIYKKE